MSARAPLRLSAWPWATSRRTGTRWASGPRAAPSTWSFSPPRMRFVLFCHSLRSDWNHGNAHFRRGVVTELNDRGHAVEVYEPADAWSVTNLVREHGAAALDRFQGAYPALRCTPYRLDLLDLDRALEGADVVLAHEWNDPELIRRLGEVRTRRPEMRLL